MKPAKHVYILRNESLEYNKSQHTPPAIPYSVSLKGLSWVIKIELSIVHTVYINKIYLL